jgi:hypothetical protein
MSYNASPQMTHSAFTIVIPQCSGALSGELYVGVDV